MWRLTDLGRHKVRAERRLSSHSRNATSEIWDATGILETLLSLRPRDVTDSIALKIYMVPVFREGKDARGGKERRLMLTAQTLNPAHRRVLATATWRRGDVEPLGILEPLRSLGTRSATDSIAFKFIWY